MQPQAPAAASAAPQRNFLALESDAKPAPQPPKEGRLSNGGTVAVITTSVSLVAVRDENDRAIVETRSQMVAALGSTTQQAVVKVMDHYDAKENRLKESMGDTRKMAAVLSDKVISKMDDTDDLDRLERMIDMTTAIPKKAAKGATEGLVEFRNESNQNMLDVLNNANRVRNDAIDAYFKASMKAEEVLRERQKTETLKEEDRLKLLKQLDQVTADRVKGEAEAQKVKALAEQEAKKAENEAALAKINGEIKAAHDQAKNEQDLKNANELAALERRRGEIEIQAKSEEIRRNNYQQKYAEFLKAMDDYKVALERAYQETGKANKSRLYSTPPRLVEDGHGGYTVTPSKIEYSTNTPTWYETFLDKVFR